MTVLAPERDASSTPSIGGRRRPDGLRSSRSSLEVITVLEAAAFSLLVGLEGSAAARSLRAGIVVGLAIVAIVSIRRGGPSLRAAVCILLGIFGTVVGAGIGGVHAVKVGLSITTIAALTALATGLWLLTAGGASVVRPLRRGWRLVAILPALALLVFGVYPLTVAVNATNRPATPIGTQTPADVGLMFQDVSFLTRDLVRLSGWYVPSRNGAAVVLLHGAGSTRSSVLEHGAVLARHGYGVLLIDTRGHGRSGGASMDLGWFGAFDIDAAVGFVLARPDVTNGEVGLVGLSMGGEQAIAAAGRDDRIGVVVAEGVSGMQAADHGWLDRYGWRGSIQIVIDHVRDAAAGLLSGAERPMALRDAIRAAAPMSVLLIAGGAEVDEGIAATWLRRASPGSVHLWIVPEAGHTTALKTDREGWEKRVTGALDTALDPKDAAR